MRSSLFDQSNSETDAQERFAVQNPQLVRVRLGDDVLAIKGSMVAYQGEVTFTHEGAGGMGRFLKKVLTTEDLPLMRVAGRGEVFFAHDAGFVYLIDLAGDGLSVNSRNLLAFDASLSWDIKRVEGAGIMAGGMFNTVLTGTGTAALCAVGRPVVLDCSQQPTYVDVQSAVAWSQHLVPEMVSSMNTGSLLRGGTGEAFQYRFHGEGFVVVQPSEGAPETGTQTESGGSFFDGLFSD